MRTRKIRTVLASLLAAIALAAAGVLGLEAVALAQEDGERSRFVRFVERQISTPNRQIRLGRIEGALSSDVRISSITISDREGAWLTIENARLVWSRLALLRGRLDVDLLEADRIAIARRPLPAAEPEDAEPIDDTPFEVPELPVAVELDRLSVPRVEIAEGVIGPAVALSVDGRIVLAGGELDVDLAIERLDRPGTLSIEAAFSNATRVLALDVILSEPENGVVANALDIEGRPPIEFEIAGEGPLSDYEARIRLSAAGEDLVTGTTTISGENGGLRFRADVGGDLSRLVPATYADLVTEGSRLEANVLRREDGGIEIDAARLTSGVARISATGELAPDGVPVALDLDARLGREDGEPIALPGGGGEATIRSGRLEATLGGPIGQRWTASFLMEDLVTPRLTAARATLAGGGEAVNMATPEARRLTFDASGGASGLGSPDPDIAAAIGESLTLEARGAWNAGEPVRIDAARLASDGTDASFAGSAGASGLIGDFRLSADDLAAFAGLADRPLAGAVDLSASGSVSPGPGLFDLELDGSASDLKVGIGAVDGLLAGRTTIGGGAARTAAGFLFDDFRIENPQLLVSADGQTTGAEVDLSARARVTDMSALSPQVSGALDLAGRIAGPNARPDVTARLSGERLVLAGTALSDLLAEVRGTLAAGTFDGDFTASGALGGAPLRAQGSIVAGGEAPPRVSGLDARIGSATLAGDLAATGAGPFTGNLSLRIPELAELAPLLLAEAAEVRGSVSADVRLSAEGERQDAAVEAEVRDLEAFGVRAGLADVDLSARDLRGVPGLEGTARVLDAQVAGYRVRSADLSASRAGGGTRFDLSADLVTARLLAAGSLAPREGGGLLARLERLSLAGEPLTLALERPASVAIGGGEVVVDDLRLTAGEGVLDVSGRWGERVDLSGRLRSFPLAVANLVRPDLSASGTLSGTFAASGTAARPTGTFRLAGNGLSAAPLAGAGLPPLDATLAGSFRDGLVTLERAAVVVGEGGVTAEGTIGDRLDLVVRIDRLPLALANAVAPDLSLSGALSGRASVTGSLASPAVDFSAEIPALGAAPLATAGIGAIAVTAEGGFRDGVVRLASARASGGGLDVAADGTIPLSGPGLDLRITADAPLGLAGRFVARRGATISGDLSADVRVTGSLAAPRVSGEVRGAGLRFADPSGIVLTDGSLLARLEGDRVAIERLAANLGTGTVSVSGTVGIAPGSGFPADLSIALRGARFVSGETLAATASGDLALAGPLATRPRLSGDILVERAEINVAGGLPGGPTLIEVMHIDAPRDVLETLRRAEVGPYAGTPRGRDAGPPAFDLLLDVTVSAPARIFVRGRGIDAELGGEVRLTGSSSSPVPVGGFELIRGRIQILTQRVTFDRGTVTLVGDLDPLLDFEAETSNNDITVFVTVTGRASNPDIQLSSVPDLPQDEVLAQLLFGKSVSALSGFQIAQLAASAAELAGGGGASPLAQLRQLTGLDDLDVVADEEGNVGVRAGRYIADNVYLGVEAAEDDAEVTVNLDVTRRLKVRAAAGTEDASIGFFYEREY